jgi:hypothetical protein
MQQPPWRDDWPSPDPPPLGFDPRAVTDGRIAELQQRLRGELLERRILSAGRMGSGIDGAILALGLELAAGLAQRGVRRFDVFVLRVAADVDASLQELRPFVRGWYNGGRDLLEDFGVDISGMDSHEAVLAARNEMDRRASIVQRGTCRRPSCRAPAHLKGDLNGPRVPTICQLCHASRPWTRNGPAS